MEKNWKTKTFEAYEKNETRLSLGFFLGGFIFDVLTLSDIDDGITILQQVVYLFFLGGILAYDFIRGPEAQLERGPLFARKFWSYRGLIFHFFLGSLLSIYSLFFLMSASAFSSIAFVLVLLGVMVGNELKVVQNSGLDAKIALFVICLFCFFSLVFPIGLGFVGRFPFLLAVVATMLTLWLYFRWLSKYVGTILLKRRLITPGALVVGLFTIFYFIGWIPPVPLSVKKMGIYHQVERVGDKYILHFEKPWWKFWQTADEDFQAEPGDKIHVFVGVFSPARFDDSVILHWALKDARRGWQTTDRIPMRVAGGRKGGYRGNAVKQNFSEGDWRVGVETTDGREIARTYFSVSRKAEPNPERVFRTEEY